MYAQEAGSDAVLGLLASILPYLGAVVILVALGFFLLLVRSITRDAKRRSARHKRIQENYIRR